MPGFSWLFRNVNTAIIKDLRNETFSHIFLKLHDSAYNYVHKSLRKIALSLHLWQFR
jgi:hypothetical protein